MSILEVKRAAQTAEARARSIAANLTDGEARTSGELAETIAQTAEVLISSAERRACLIPRVEAERCKNVIMDGTSAILDKLADGKVSTASALASLDRLREQELVLRLTVHRRDAWQAAVTSLQELADGQ